MEQGAESETVPTRLIMPKQKQFLKLNKKKEKHPVTVRKYQPPPPPMLPPHATTFPLGPRDGRRVPGRYSCNPNGPQSWPWADVSSAGVEFEEAGEKWRAGDAFKSCRFFTRAIDVYDAGLRRHPHSFDLAYNKSVVNNLHEMVQGSGIPSLTFC